MKSFKDPLNKDFVKIKLEALLVMLTTVICFLGFNVWGEGLVDC